MEGQFYHSFIDPAYNVATTSVLTLTASNQIAFVSHQMPILGPNYFNYVGKFLHIKCAGIATSGATPGNFQWYWYWGPNTAATGTILASVALTWTASQSTTSFTGDLWVRCRQIGASGSLYAEGTVFLQSSGLAQCNFSSPAAVGCDLTQSYYIAPQLNRTGSTVETWQGMDYFAEALN